MHNFSHLFFFFLCLRVENLHFVYIYYILIPPPTSKPSNKQKHLSGPSKNCSSRKKYKNFKYIAAEQKQFRELWYSSGDWKKATTHLLSFILCVLILIFQKKVYCGLLVSALTAGCEPGLSGMASNTRECLLDSCPDPY